MRNAPLAAGLLLCLAQATSGQSVAADPSSDRRDDLIRVIRHQPPPAALVMQRQLRQEPPLLRGYRAWITETEYEPWPHDPPDEKSPPEYRAAAQHVAAHLACDGLLPTTARVIEILGPHRFTTADHEAILMLRAAGLPVDLLAWFQPPGASGEYAVVEHISQLLAQGRAAETLSPELAHIPFIPQAAAPGLKLATEDGSHSPKLVRLQLAGAAVWRGPGDGTAIDIAEQLAAALPQTDFLISTSHDALAEVASAVRKWPSDGRTGRITALGSPWKPEQWAQDNGKPAILYGVGQTPQIATLAPRYASRGEERTVLDPGETFTTEALAAAGHHVVQSPLLFQGGNLMAVEDPRDGRRTLLVGEAEILRNTALGLTREQVLHALAVECGVDRCIVLPAVSFHIDVELCARRHRGQLVFLVNDETAAARAILSIGADALSRGGYLSTQAVEEIKAALAAKDDAKAVELLAPAVLEHSDGGVFPMAVAAQFGRGETDAPAANFQRFLLALDILAAAITAESDLPAEPFTRAYVLALQQRAAQRQRLWAMLADEGWRVVAVPSLSDERRGVNYVNGFHLPGRYLMPAYGGLFDGLDDLAASAIRSALDDEVEVVKIYCAETQRRLGAIHCAAAIYPEG